MLAMRLDSAKNAAIAPTSQMSSSLKPCSRSAAISASSSSWLRVATFSAKANRLLARHDVRLAIVHGNLVGHAGVLCVDAQDRAVRDDAAPAAVRARRGDDDHLALRLGEPAVLEHQRVVVSEYITI